MSFSKGSFMRKETDIIGLLSTGYFTASSDNGWFLADWLDCDLKLTWKYAKNFCSKTLTPKICKIRLLLRTFFTIGPCRKPQLNIWNCKTYKNKGKGAYQQNFISCLKKRSDMHREPHFIWYGQNLEMKIIHPLGHLSN